MAAKVEILRETLLHAGRFRLMRTLAEIEERDGTRRQIDHEIYLHKAAAAVLLIDPERHKVMLVKQFRLPAYLEGGFRELTEACAGMLDGDPPEVCARREALEETGVRVRDIEPAFEFFTSPGAITEQISGFVATYRPEDIVGAGGGVDADERTEAIELDFEEALARIDRGEIRDGKTIALIFYARVKGLM
jgi:GDP-mannose pyrophosphatase NudK